jgi:hypothetical protein
MFYGIETKTYSKSSAQYLLLFSNIKLPVVSESSFFKKIIFFNSFLNRIIDKNRNFVATQKNYSQLINHISD